MSEQPPPINPYAIPSSDLVIPAHAVLARIEGKHLVVPKNWQSPPVCLLTGETHPLTQMRKAKLSWSNPVWILLIFAGVLVYVLVALLVQKRGTIHHYLSVPKAASARKWLLGNWGICGASLVCFAGAFSLSSPNLAWLGAALLLLCLIFAATVCRVIKVAKMDKTTIWLAGIPRTVQEMILRMDQEQHWIAPGVAGGSGPWTPPPLR